MSAPGDDTVAVPTESGPAPSAGDPAAGGPATVDQAPVDRASVDQAPVVEAPVVEAVAPAEAASAPVSSQMARPLAVIDTVEVCASCGAQVYPDEQFCENCGAELSAGLAARTAAGGSAAGGSAAGESGAAGTNAERDAEPPTQPSAQVPTEPSPSSPTQPVDSDSVATICANCGGAIATDGYCSTCGAPAVRKRDHWLEQPASWVASVCDRGIRHHRNEDGVALSATPEPGSRAVLVVCDGVSSSIDSDIASLAAARAARDVLSVVASGGPSVAGRIRYWTDLLTEAAVAANAEVVDVAAHPTGRPGERQNSPASCTFVAAVIDGPVIVAGWVGDSRAYWLPDSGKAEQLSVDDSWATAAVLSGMPRAQAEAAPQAHAITRWLGVDSPDFEPRCTTTTPDGAGWLLVCSDGLWNYCSPASEMAVLVSRTAHSVGNDPARAAAELVNWANLQGGMDNITVALARVPVRGSAAQDRDVPDA